MPLSHTICLKSGLSIVIPVYNSEQTLQPLLERLSKVLSRIETPQYEVIMVSDGSKDRSWEVILALTAQYTFVRGIDLSCNFGQHNALLCGIRAARFDICITLDDDLQNPPEEIPSLLSKLAEGNDVVYGTATQLQHGVWRNLASRLTKSVLANAMGADIATKVSAFRAFRTSLRVAFEHYESPFISLDVLLTWATARFAAVSVKQEPRTVGLSNYTLRRLLTHTMNMMTGYSTRPLRIASLVGFSFTLFGIAILIYVILAYIIQGSSVPGFPFLASIVAIFSGAQLFALGIVGEYLARMHVRTMGKPPYVVRSTTERD